MPLKKYKSKKNKNTSKVHLRIKIKKEEVFKK